MDIPFTVHDYCIGYESHLKCLQDFDEEKKVFSVVELVGLLCAQLCSVSNSTARPYALRFPTTTPRPTMLQLGQSHYNWVGHAIIRLVTLLSGLSGALSLPAFVPLLCTLFPTTPCEGLAFTYMLPI